MEKSKQFDELLKRYQAGTLSTEETAEVDTWLDQHMSANAYEQLSEREQTKLQNEIGEYLENRISRRQIVMRYAWRIAAAIALLITASFTLWQWQATDMVNVQTISATQKVILPDGSIIWLKENSTLTYPEEFSTDTRNISFTGEALFEIEKDPLHPFIISCNGITAKVLGTSFNIKSTSQGNTEVTVLTGKVSVTTLNSRTELIVLPYEKVVYSNNNQQLVKAIVEETVIQPLVKDTEYSMSFEDTYMRDVVVRMERKFDLTITLNDSTMGNCRVTADFTDQSLKETLDIVTKTMGYTYQIKDKHIVLNGTGCK